MAIFDRLFGGGTPSGDGSFADRGILNKLLLAAGGTKAVQGTMNQDAVKDVYSDVNSGAINKAEALARYAERSGDPRAIIQEGGTPAAIQEYAYFNTLDPAGQSRYLQIKRANQMFDRGGSQVVLDPQGNQVVEIPKTLAPENLPTTKGAQAKAAETGKNQADKEIQFPAVEANVNSAVKIIDDILEDPGLAESVGGVGGIRGRVAQRLPLSEGQRNFQPKADQLKGKAFLSAFQSLKGAGAITEKEGEAATKAEARMSQAQDEKSYREALGEYRNILIGSLERARKGITSTPTIMQPEGNNIPGVNVIDFGELPE